jgi:uncharacterized protein
MTDAELVTKTAEYVQKKFEKEGTGHDWFHIERVWKLAKRIAKEEQGVDLLVVELAALLHDIADWKFYEGDLEAGPKAAREWLEKNLLDNQIILKVEDIVRNISFKGANVKLKIDTIEGKIVFDADKLDAIGAIGIARCFAFGGSIGSPMYDPSHKPKMHDSFEEYKKMGVSSVTHFYEKLLLLKDRMFTETAREMAQHRHKIMEEYLKEFYAEWEGKL